MTASSSIDWTFYRPTDRPTHVRSATRLNTRRPVSRLQPVVGRRPRCGRHRRRLTRLVMSLRSPPAVGSTLPRVRESLTSHGAIRSSSAPPPHVPYPHLRRRTTTMHVLNKCVSSCLRQLQSPRQRCHTSHTNDNDHRGDDDVVRLTALCSPQSYSLSAAWRAMRKIMHAAAAAADASATTDRRCRYPRSCDRRPLYRSSSSSATAARRIHRQSARRCPGRFLHDLPSRSVHIRLVWFSSSASVVSTVSCSVSPAAAANPSPSGPLYSRGSDAKMFGRPVCSFSLPPTGRSENYFHDIASSHTTRTLAADVLVSRRPDSDRIRPFHDRVQFDVRDSSWPIPCTR